MASPEIKRKKSHGDNDDGDDDGDVADHDLGSSELNACERFANETTTTATTLLETFQHGRSTIEPIRGSDDVKGVNDASRANGSVVDNRHEGGKVDGVVEIESTLGSGGGMIAGKSKDDVDVVRGHAAAIDRHSSQREIRSSSSSSVITVIREKYGYDFDAEGRLRDVKTGGPFQFDAFDGDRKRNQKRYENFGELITSHVYDLLETSVNLQRMTIPLDAEENEPTGFIFASQDFHTNPNLLVLIHGSGVVRAGQWARRLIINDCLDSGTQLPFILEGESRGFSVLVLNTNHNKSRVPSKKDDVDDDDDEKKLAPIRGSRDAREHGAYVWEKIVMEKKNLEQVLVVAHSFGGVVTLDIASEFSSFWRSHVKAVAFTDSVHGDQRLTFNPRLASWFSNNAVNWVTSNEEVDVPLTWESTVPCVSAGHTNHENTSWSAFKSIFKFFEEKLNKSKD